MINHSEMILIHQATTNQYNNQADIFQVVQHLQIMVVDLFRGFEALKQSFVTRATWIDLEVWFQR